jgi:hypothetical protein
MGMLIYDLCANTLVNVNPGIADVTDFYMEVIYD